MNDDRRIFLLRHGETEWSKSGQHTGRTDLPLTEAGRAMARRSAPMLSHVAFAKVLCSPLRRARQTCELAGLAQQATFDDDLVEWHYGRYEGLTSVQIHEQRPGWDVFEDGGPDGESPGDVARRVERVIRRVEQIDGNIAIVAHGHLLRVLTARWLGRPADFGRNLLFDTGRYSILSYYHGEARAIECWNVLPSVEQLEE